ncbi:MAG: phage holin [Clostridia bacterium]|nr:phage holin [Clostridia bacterium]
MEWMKEILFDVIFALLGVVLTGVVTWLGTLAGKLWREKADDIWVRNLAGTCVQAVEQMYRDRNGEEKISLAMEMCENFAKARGISVSSEQIRVFLESALAELKDAFRKEAEK